MNLLVAWIKGPKELSNKLSKRKFNSANNTSEENVPTWNHVDSLLEPGIRVIHTKESLFWIVIV